MIQANILLDLLDQAKSIIAMEKNDIKKAEKILCLLKDFLNAEYVIYYHLSKYKTLENILSVGEYEELLRQFSFKMGQGVVGYVLNSKEVLQLNKLREHPKYIRLMVDDKIADLGFIGIPVVIGGKSVGVIVVKGKSLLKITPEIAKVIETIGIFIGEIAIKIMSHKKSYKDVNLEKPYMAYGNIISQGLAIGKAYVHEIFRPESFIRIDDPEKEIKKLHYYLKMLQDNLSNLDKEKLTPIINNYSENYEIIEVHKMLVNDQEWVSNIETEINSGYNLTSAIIKAQQKLEAKFSDLTNEKLRERVFDFEDLSNKLLSYINNDENNKHKTKEKTKQGNIDNSTLNAQNKCSGKIIFARRMGPADLLEYVANGACGIVFEESLYSSHVAILARSVNIPVISGVSNITTHVKNEDLVILDGDTGSLFLRPTEYVHQEFIKRIERKQKEVSKAERKDNQHNDTYLTKDGVEIELYLNAGLQRDIEHIDEVKGIGLFRTEIPFMMRSQYPDEEAQKQLYERVYKLSKGKPVNFRTLDIGGDKRLPYFSHSIEDNPIMGWRAIRMTLDRPTILRQQIKALLLASRGRDLRIILPMVTQVNEFIRAKEILEKEIDHLEFQGIDLPNDIRLGSMIEIPAIIWQLPELLQYADFISVGTNDLFQFFFAIDRENSMLSKRYDPLSTSFVRMLSHIADQCKKTKTPVFVCGEMARYPLQALILLGIGFRKLSTNYLGTVELRRMIESVDIGKLEKFTKSLIKKPLINIRNEVIAFAKENNIVI